MRHFSVEEFDNYSNMSPEIVCALEKYRDKLKCPVFLSPAPGAQWREDNSKSYHNIKLYGQSKACDIFPSSNMWLAFITALQIPEINGIGLYPYWNFGKLNYGLHLDVREADSTVVWWRDKENEYHTIWSTQDIVNFFEHTVERLRSV